MSYLHFACKRPYIFPLQPQVLGNIKYQLPPPTGARCMHACTHAHMNARTPIGTHNLVTAEKGEQQCNLINSKPINMFHKCVKKTVCVQLSSAAILMVKTWEYAEL